MKTGTFYAESKENHLNNGGLGPIKDNDMRHFHLDNLDSWKVNRQRYPPPILFLLLVQDEEEILPHSCWWWWHNKEGAPLWEAHRQCSEKQMSSKARKMAMNQQSPREPYPNDKWIQEVHVRLKEFRMSGFFNSSIRALRKLPCTTEMSDACSRKYLLATPSLEIITFT